MPVRDLEIYGPVTFNNLLEILSWPITFQGFTIFINSKTPSQTMFEIQILSLL